MTAGDAVSTEFMRSVLRVGRIRVGRMRALLLHVNQSGSAGEAHVDFVQAWPHSTLAVVFTPASELLVAVSWRLGLGTH